jgi:transketolase
MISLKNLRSGILKAASNSGEGHVPSALSILDILYVLYDEFIPSKVFSSNSNFENRFILSKGHASLALYAVLNHHGRISDDDFYSFAKFESNLGGHPDRNKISGVESSTGSLGHGLPQGIGLAMALRIKESSGHVYVLIGDGEANEGTIWESALLAPHHKLENLTCIVDNNLSSERALDMGKFSEKFAAFGWKTIEIDGHDHDAIRSALKIREVGRPIAIIANTVKGYGVLSMESNPEWHHRSPNLVELEFLLGDMR